MKKTIRQFFPFFLFFQLLLFPFVNAQSSQDAEARAYFFAAEVAYDEGQYQKALDAIAKVEKMLGKGNAKLSSLRVQALYALKRYGEARREINRFYTFKASNSLSREMASIMLKVDDLIAAEARRKEIERVRLVELARQAEVNRLAEVKKEKERLILERTVKPVPEIRVSPEYPILAARSGIEGWVKVTLTVSKEGRVKYCEVLEEQPGLYFGEAACDAVNQWKYIPATLDGSNVEYRINALGFDFTLD